MKDRVTELADAAGTDKGSGGHNYTPIYSKLFEPFLNTTDCVLELGILHGASLYVWDTLFPKARIVGVDLDANYPAAARTKFNLSERVSFEVCDQFQAAAQAEIAARHAPFAIVIDDCGHTWEAQKTSFDAIFPYMIPGGLYIIEDCDADNYKAVEFFNGRPNVEIYCDRKLVVIRG